MENFGSYLRELREKRGLSLRELSRLAKVATGYLSQVEREKRKPPTPAILKKLAPILEITARELMAKAGYLEEETSQTEREIIESAFEFLTHHPRLRNKMYFKKLPLVAKKALVELYEAITGKQLLYPPQLMELRIFKKLAQEDLLDAEAWGKPEWSPPTQITIPGQGTIDLQDSFLDLSQAAEFLICSEVHVKKLVNEGALPCVAKLRGHPIFSKRVLEAWVKARTSPGAK